MVGPQLKRQAVNVLREERGFGITRACGLIGITDRISELKDSIFCGPNDDVIAHSDNHRVPRCNPGGRFRATDRAVLRPMNGRLDVQTDFGGHKSSLSGVQSPGSSSPFRTGQTQPSQIRAASPPAPFLKDPRSLKGQTCSGSQLGHANC
jgi:hypothetical protein